ncbi:hypothetical protein KY342_06415 [Candidatus Woesearchaeota archaeon]|nr:hypothetical protein [Candidatus Woesearchaeota archaeon]
MKPVKFHIQLEKDIEANDVKGELERLASDMPIQLRHDDVLNWLIGTTNQFTYEKLFSTILEYETKVAHNVNEGPFLTGKWVERKPAQVPAALKDKVKGIYLSKTVHLTD